MRTGRARTPAHDEAMSAKRQSRMKSTTVPDRARRHQPHVTDVRGPPADARSAGSAREPLRRRRREKLDRELLHLA